MNKSSDCQPTHVPLYARMALFIKQCSFQIDQQEGDSWRANNDKLTDDEKLKIARCLSTLRGELEQLCRNLFDASSCNTPMDQELSRIEESLKEQIDTLFPNKKVADLEIRIKETCRLLKSVSCHECKTISNLDFICAGNQREDSVLVDRGGLCFRFVLDVAKYVDETTSTMYAPILKRLNIQKPKVAFSTGLRKEARPHKLNHASHISGSTSFHDTETPHNSLSNIRLIISEHYNYASALCLLYVISHEYICHAYQQLVYSHTKSRTRPPNCRFSEGWMDAVAHSFVRKCVESPSDDLPIDLLQDRPRFLSEIQGLYDARYADEAPEQPRRRLLGVQAFRRLELCFWYNIRQTNKSDQIMSFSALEFSLFLNVMATEDELDIIVSLLLKLLPFSISVPGYHSRSKAVIEAIHYFMRELSIKSLISELTSLDNELAGA